MIRAYLLILVLFIFSEVNAQSNIFPENGNVGIGTLSPQFKLQINSGHSDTNFNLHYENSDLTKYADLTLWASEPGLTWTGVGIGNNVYNSVAGLAGIVRISNLKGGSYLRLLDQEIRLNIIKLDGTDISALAVDANGNIGIGTLAPSSKLAVNGKIRAHEIKVEVANWPDYVFVKGYQLPTLQETEQHIKQKGHLKDIPSAEEVKANGIDLGEMNAMLLKKIEELTLHLIQLKKDNDDQRRLNDERHTKVQVQMNELKSKL